MHFPIDLLKESQIIEKAEDIFAVDKLTEIAKTSGFIKRKSKFTALAFLQVCLLNAFKASSKSLSQICTLLKETVGIKLRKQSQADPG